MAQVVFELETRDGWPPVGAERVWAAPIDDTRFRIANAPWFARGVAEGDVVRATPRSGFDVPVVDEILEASGNLTIRVVPLRDGPLSGDPRAVLDRFAPLGVTGEAAGVYVIVALTIPRGLDRAPVKSLLIRGTEAGWWDYEEGCVDDTWTGV